MQACRQAGGNIRRMHKAAAAVVVKPCRSKEMLGFHPTWKEGRKDVERQALVIIVIIIDI